MMETTAEITIERADDSPRIMLIVPPGKKTHTTLNQRFDFIVGT